MRIKVLRKAKGLSQQQVADNMGVVRNAVSNWETEASLPNARQLPLLAQVLECSVSELFVGPVADAEDGA